MKKSEYEKMKKEKEEKKLKEEKLEKEKEKEKPSKIELDNTSDKDKEKEIEKKKKMIELLKQQKTKQNPELVISDGYSTHTIKIKNQEENDVIEYKPNKISKISIFCDELVEEESYNEYQKELNNTVNVNKIELSEIQFTKRDDDNITNENNLLIIKKENETYEIEIPTDYYNRYELIETINDVINDIGIEIILDEHDHCIIKSTDSIPFNMYDINPNNDIEDSEINTILPVLGFKNTTYINKIEYTSEKDIEIGDNIYYLVIDNINNEPICQINLDTNKIKYINNEYNNIELDVLDIKINKTYNTLVKNNPLYDHFFNNSHSYVIKFN